MSPRFNAPNLSRGPGLSSKINGKFLGAVHWVGAVTHGAEGSYLSYVFLFALRLRRYNGSIWALL
ncbi:hypothetical protein [Ruegeria profundi]|nr:hypothetical protein [Ruegeria profundi]